MNGRPMRTIWWAEDGAVEVLDQTRLPHEVVTVRWRSVEDAAQGIEAMQVRGAPLIGVAAAHGLALAMAENSSDDGLTHGADRLGATRPTAVNLRWALDRMTDALRSVDPSGRAVAAAALAAQLAEADVAACKGIAQSGLPIVRALAHGRGSEPVRVMTHCNAGWLAAVDWGTALAPIYRAHDDGIPVHVWVSETRPRNQGASLTAWELGAHRVPYTLVADNACGHLVATGQVDAVFVGADRIAANGDVANKIGTYLKALAAQASQVPFYVVAPTSTIDHFCPDGSVIPIEERRAEEVTHMRGVDTGGSMATIRVTPAGTEAVNPAFDVTPAHLVTALVTEQGVVAYTPSGVAFRRSTGSGGRDRGM